MSIGWLFHGDHEEVSRAIENLATDSDRGAAIVAASVAESRLLKAIEFKLTSDADVVNNLFQPDGALGAFKPRIWLAFLLGLISSEAMRELIAMANIRNKFAHRLSIVSFDDKEIATLMKGLTIVDRAVEDLSGDELRAMIERHQSMNPDEFAQHVREEHERRMVAPSTEPLKARFTGATEALKDPRKRFIMTAQIFAYALGQPDSPYARFPLI